MRPDGMENIEKGANVIQKFIDWSKNTSLRNVAHAFANYIIILLAILLTIFIFNPQKVIDRVVGTYRALESQEHKEMVDKRIEVEPQIRLSIKEARLEANADRGFILEFHNSVKSLNNVPFIYADMRYEDCRIDEEPVDYDYQNQPISRYPMASYLFENGYYFGRVEDIKEIDYRLGKKLEFDGIQWIALVQLEGVDEKIGLFGLSYMEEPDITEINKIKRISQMTASKISLLLN